MRIRTIGFIAALCLGLLAPLLLAEAQHAGKVYRIGFLTTGSVEAFKTQLAALRQGLHELGYLEGKNVVIEERYAAGRRERLPELAVDLIRLKMDILVTHGTPSPRAAKEATKTIPIVLVASADPLGGGLVASLARPGGNVTGLSDLHGDLAPKRLELLKEVVPSASRVAVLWTPANSIIADQLETLQAVAPALGVMLLPVELTAPEDIDRAFAVLRQERPDALNVLGYPLIGRYRQQIAEFALRNGLPAISTNEQIAKAGLLMTYGTNHLDIYRRAATYVDKILKGAKPADLPVEQPVKFDLVINLKTAKALGLTIPPTVLYQATKVIR